MALADTVFARRKPNAPVLERSRTLADRLQFCTPIYEGQFDSNDEIQDLVAAAGNLKRAASGTLTWSEDEFGPKVGATVSPKWAEATFANGAIGKLTDPFTFLWFGFWPSAGISNDETILSWGDGVSASASRLNIRWHLNTIKIEVIFETPGTPRSVFIAAVDFLDLPLVIIARHDPFAGLDAYVNGQFLGPDTTAMSGVPVADPDNLMINAYRLTTSVPTTSEADAQHHIVAKWGRVLADAEVFQLIEDPFLLTREDRSLHPWRYPIRARMPCPEFPIQRMLLKPIDQVSPKDGGILHAAKANRIDIDEVNIRLAALDDEEVTMLLNCWNDGLGQVDPFWMRLPEEDEERLYVFRDSRLSIVHGSTAARGAIAKLRDVTRFGNP